MRVRIFVCLLVSLVVCGLWLIRSTAKISPSAKTAAKSVTGASPPPIANGEDVGIWSIENQLIPPFMPKEKPAPLRSILSRMKELRVPAVSIAVVRKAELLWTRAYGMVDVSTGRPATPHTLFQAASLSKPITAATALTLVQSNRIGLDDDVNTKFTSWKVPMENHNPLRKVTLRWLLSHAAGLSIEGFPGYAHDQPRPTLRQILDGVPPANTAPVRLQAEPGLQYQYSGGGYEVVHLLINELTGIDFQTVVAERVFKPLNLVDSTYDPKDRSGRELATGYAGDGQSVKGNYYAYPELAAAGLWTTAGDYARFGAELQRAREGSSNRLLARATAVEMLSEQMKPGGLGFELRDGAAKWFLHTGMNAGFQCIALFSDRGDGIVVMTNSDSGMVLAREIVATAARAYGWEDYYPETRPTAALTEQALQEYAGTYSAGRFGTIVVEAYNDHLLIGTQSRPAVEFFPESDHVFFPETPGFKARFRRNLFGNVSAISFGKLVAPRK